MDSIIRYASSLYGLEDFELLRVPGHDCGRNTVFICQKDDEFRYVLRISDTCDRTEEEYLGET